MKSILTYGHLIDRTQARDTRVAEPSVNDAHETSCTQTYPMVTTVMVTIVTMMTMVTMVDKKTVKVNKDDKNNV